jgi:hypothetical protein
MRCFVMLLLLAASLFGEAGPVRAQATADQLNKLSLEALTAPSAGGGGYGRRSYRSTRSYASSGRRSYARGYRRSNTRRGRYGGYRATAGSRHRTAVRHAFGRSYRRHYRGHGHVVVHRHRQSRRHT